MNETTLPPSPNWYASNILACSRRGTVAWGAKNFIVIAKRKEDNDTLQYSLINDPSTIHDRINAVAFCPHDNSTDPELLISASDDDKIRVWNVDALELIAEFSFNNGSKIIVGVDWSTINVACAVTSEGYLMYCNVQYQTSKVVFVGKLTATCLACCPHKADLVAIGTRSGLIYIVDNEQTMYRLRGHNEEISCLSWCPSPMNVANDKRDLLLASGGKDKFVFIWRVGRDGRYEMVIHLPNAPSTDYCESHKSKLGVKSGSWTAVCWADPRTLLTSSLWGELLSWDLSKHVSTTVNSNKLKLLHTVIHTYHSRGLFCIAVKFNDSDTSSSNQSATSELTVWTLAQDRWLVCCKRDSGSDKLSLKYRIPTQAGYVYCMASCPIETSRIAIGVGDEMLRLWNLSESQTFDVLMHWQKIKGKIRSISWFPEDESTVAFGTSDGRIGIFQAIDSLNKPPVLFRQYHRNIVYKIEWVQLESEYYLFSCSEQELVAFKKSNPDADPMSIVKVGCTEFSWKSNVCLAVAMANGSIIFYDRHLIKQGSTIHIVRSIVNCLAWHPDSTSMDKWMSPNANYLAIASDSHNILIYDLTELIQILITPATHPEVSSPRQHDFNSEESLKTYKLVATLKGHANRVVCLAWSPHMSGHLVSGSYDGTAQVWNVRKQELLGTFYGHDGPVLSCMWSPLKPQFIITGSSDFTLRVWDYSTTAQSQLDAKKPNFKLPKKVQSKTDSVSSVNPTECTKSDTFTQIHKKKEKRYFGRYNRVADKTKILEFIKTDIRKNHDKNEKNSLDDLSLFCEKREDFLTLIAAEQSMQEDSNTIAEMSLWWNRSESGYTMSLQDHLRKAAKNQQLNDFLVSLAPNVSMRMWREMCEAYAHQLIMQKNVEKAVSYLLCTQQIYKAIDEFLNVKMFKESYVLARSRLDDDDPIVKKILLNWSEYAFETGQLEQAAHCYIKLGNLEKAAEILARRKNLRCLELASELAFLNGDEGYGVSLILDAVKRSLINLNWSKARSLIANVRRLQYLNAHIDIHEAIMSLYEKEPTFNLFLAWLQKEENSGVLQSLNKEYDASYYEVLCKDDIINAASKKEDETNAVYLSTSYELAKAVMCTAKETKLKHIAKALNIAFENEKILTEKAAKHGTRADHRFFIYILTMLGGKPTDEPDEPDNIYARNNCGLSQSIRAYLCFGILDWILNYSDQLSVEEETMGTQLVLNLLTDAISEITVFYENRFNEIDKLATQLTDFMCSPNYNKEEYDKLMLEMEKLQIIEKLFKTERVCMPNPSIIFFKTCSVVDQLRDDENKYILLDCLNTLCETGKITPLTLEEHLLVKLKFLRQNLTSLIMERCRLEDDTVDDTLDGKLKDETLDDKSEDHTLDDKLEKHTLDDKLEDHTLDDKLEDDTLDDESYIELLRKNNSSVNTNDFIKET